MVKLKELSKVYASQKVALHPMTAEIQAGTLVGLIGANGAGKSTLIHLIAGVLRPTTGSIHFAFQDAVSLAWVSQNTSLDWYLDVYNNVRLGARLAGFGLQASRQLTEQAINLLQITDLQKQDVETISGGQQRRVQIARAIAQQPELLILDEPTIGLDYQACIHLMEYFQTLAKQGKSILIASHDLTLLEKYIDHVWFLNQGVLEINQPLEQFLSTHQQEQPVREMVVHYQGNLSDDFCMQLENVGVQILHKTPLVVNLIGNLDSNELIKMLLTQVKIEAMQPKTMGLAQVYEAIS